MTVEHRDHPRRPSTTVRPQGRPQRSRQERVAQARQGPAVDAGGPAVLADRGAARVHRAPVRRLHQRGQHHHGPAAGHAARAGHHRPDPRTPGRVSRPVGRVDDQLRRRDRLVSDRCRRLHVRHRHGDRCRPRGWTGTGVGQRRAHSGSQDPIADRHVGDAQHPRRHLAHDATDPSGCHQRRPRVVPPHERRADPDRVHRDRDRRRAARSVVARLRVRATGAGGRVRRPCCEAGRDQEQRDPCPRSRCSRA